MLRNWLPVHHWNRPHFKFEYQICVCFDEKKLIVCHRCNVKKFPQALNLNHCPCQSMKVETKLVKQPEHEIRNFLLYDMLERLHSKIFMTLQRRTNIFITKVSCIGLKMWQWLAQLAEYLDWSVDTYLYYYRSQNHTLPVVHQLRKKVWKI